MAGPDHRLFQRWIHSYEEDHDDVLVFRPADFAFPPARGRDGLEFRADGTYVDWAIGAGDAADPREGSWRSVSDAVVETATPMSGHRRFELRYVGPDRLEVVRGSE